MSYAMTNSGVIEAYFDPRRNPRATGSNHNGSLSFDGDTLFSYQTAIGKIADGAFYILRTRFSTTTSRHQNMARAQAFTVLNSVKAVDKL